MPLYANWQSDLTQNQMFDRSTRSRGTVQNTADGKLVKSTVCKTAVFRLCRFEPYLRYNNIESWVSGLNQYTANVPSPEKVFVDSNSTLSTMEVRKAGVLICLENSDVGKLTCRIVPYSLRTKPVKKFEYYLFRMKIDITLYPV